MTDNANPEGPLLDLHVYDRAVSYFEREVEVAQALSHSLAWQKTDSRRTWACVLFTRLCVICLSLVKVIPRSSLSSEASNEHWDFSTVSSLSRNVFECVIFLYYFCADSIPEDEWLARCHLMNLHDCCARIKLFSADQKDFSRDSGDLNSVLPELKSRLEKTQFFQALPEKQQKRFMTGEHAMFFNQDEVLERMGSGKEGLRTIYRYLSAHTHTLPIAFHRMLDRDRGVGIETDYERRNIAALIPNVGDWLRRATFEMQGLFPNTVGPHLPARPRHGPKPSSLLMSMMKNRTR